MMTRQKRIFLVLAAIFFVVIGFVAFDISRRTTFPGSKPQLKERIKQMYAEDSTAQQQDSLQQLVH